MLRRCTLLHFHDDVMFYILSHQMHFINKVHIRISPIHKFVAYLSFETIIKMLKMIILIVFLNSPLLLEAFYITFQRLNYPSLGFLSFFFWCSEQANDLVRNIY